MEKYDPFKERTELAKGHKVLKTIDLRMPESGKEKAPELQASIVVEESLESVAYSQTAVENFVNSVKRGYILPELRPDGELDILLLEVRELPKELAHVTTRPNFARNVDKPIWGVIDPDQFTYLQTTDFGVEGYFGNDYWVSITGKPAELVRVYIDAEKLKKLRGIYLDPESLSATEEEFGHAFVVVGGIPREAIVKAEVVEVPVRPTKDFAPKFPISLPPKETEQDIEARKKQLREFLEKKKA